MTFGNWLKEKRTERRISGTELEKLSGMSRQYISNLERNVLSDTTQRPIRPSEETVTKLAKALGVPVDEARLAAGYAPSNLQAGKPRTLEELLDRLEQLGVENFISIEHDSLQNASPDDLQKILDAVKFAVDYELSKRLKRYAPHPPPDNADTRGRGDNTG
jgi:transcriptional regulator with XRE-family HTH domain